MINYIENRKFAMQGAANRYCRIDTKVHRRLKLTGWIKNGFLAWAFITCSVAIGQQDKLDSIIRCAHEQGFYGSVVVAKDGKPIYSNIVGPDIVEGTDALQQCYPIASITKFITSILVFQCIEENLVQLGSSFSHERIPAIPEAYGAVSIESLLLHNSGLPKETDEMFDAYRSPIKMLKGSFRNQGRTDPSFTYKNVDYILLGLILEEITGKPYASLLKERIIEPLGLKRTGLITQRTDYDLFPLAYKSNGKTYGNIGSSFYLENYHSAGAIYASTGDLLQLDIALREGKLLSLEAQGKLYTTFPEFNYSAYGVWVYNYPFLPNYPKIMERRGNIKGYRSVLVRFLEKDVSIIVLANSDYFDPSSFGDLENLKEVLIKVADGI